MSKIRKTNACSHCSFPMRHRKANCYRKTMETESRVSPSAHSCSAVQPTAEQVMVLDSGSVGSEESFRMLNVPAEPAVTQQEQQFLLERHHGSGSTTGDRPNVSRPTADGQGEQGSADLARLNAEDLNNTGVLQSVRVWTDETDDNADTWEAANSTLQQSQCVILLSDGDWWGMSATICFRGLNLWGVHWQFCEKCSRRLGTCCENQCQSKPLTDVRKESMVGFVM